MVCVTLAELTRNEKCGEGPGSRMEHLLAALTAGIFALALVAVKTFVLATPSMSLTGVLRVKKLGMRIASFLAAGLLAACANTVGHFTPTAASDPANTVLYVYRPAATSPGLMKPLKFDYPDVQIDGRSIGVLKYDEYLVSELTPGAHKLTITGLTTIAKGWSERDIEHTIPANRGKQAFMKLQVEYDTDQMTIGQLGPRYTIKLIPVDADDAIYEIRNTTPATR